MMNMVNILTSQLQHWNRHYKHVSMLIMEMPPAFPRGIIVGAIVAKTTG